MSKDNSKQSLKSKGQPLDNILLPNNNFSNIINNIDLKINEQISNEYIIIDKKFRTTSGEKNISSNNTENNLQKIPISSNNSIDFKKMDKNTLSVILIIYKDLISMIDGEKLNYFKLEYNKISNIVNNNDVNSYESIINIFKKSFVEIINEKTKELTNNINELKSSILLLEKNNKYYIQHNFLKQTKIDILENEIDSYMEMEEEFDEMKEKLKYENGKFLHNEKKENEILILRAENSNLKKIVDKYEKTIEEKEQIIESIKKKSVSVLNTNNNTLKNSIDFNESENNQRSSLIFIQQNKNHKQGENKFALNNSNITNFKSFNIIQKIKSPNNNIENNNKTNNNSQCLNSKKVNNAEGNNTNYTTNKKYNIGNRASTKELISKKIKNKVLNMKKIRRINDSCLDNYNKSSAHITNSIMSNNSNNSGSKRLKKSINSFFKNSNNNSNNNIFKGITRIHKKISSGLVNTNINNIIKNNSNKIIVNSILENNNRHNKSNNSNSFFFKTSRKKFGITKKSLKANIKHQKEEFLLVRNNHSLKKSPNTFNSHEIDNSLGIKSNIIINNIIQNSASIPISEATSRSKGKKIIVENEHIQNIKNNSNHKYSNIYMKKDKSKSLGHFSINIRKKNE